MQKLTMRQRFAALISGSIPEQHVAKAPEMKALPPAAPLGIPLGTTRGVSGTMMSASLTRRAEELDLQARQDEAVHLAIARQAGTTLGEWSERKGVKDGLKASTWVYACINRIARSASAVPWQLQRRVGDDEWEAVKGAHPLTDLINAPNPLWSRQDLIERMVFHLYLAGNAIGHKVRGLGDAIEEIWLISPDMIRPIPDPVEIVRGYRVGTAPGLEIPLEDIIHNMFTDPADPAWGLSPLQVIAQTVASDVKARDWQESSMDNRATPDGVLSFHRALSEEQYRDAQRKLRGTWAGPKNARGVAVLSGTEASWIPLSLSPLEMDFLNSRKFTREEICSVFNVPPPLVGIYEQATLANIETSRVIFWQETVIPLLEDLAETFNRSLTPEFGEDIRLVPDLSKVPALQDLTLSRVAAAAQLASIGFPINAINQRLSLGFDPVPGGDMGLTGAGLTPIAVYGSEGLGFGGEGFGDPFGELPQLDPNVDRGSLKGQDDEGQPGESGAPEQRALARALRELEVAKVAGNDEMITRAQERVWRAEESLALQEAREDAE